MNGGGVRRKFDGTGTWASTYVEGNSTRGRRYQIGSMQGTCSHHHSIALSLVIVSGSLHAPTATASHYWRMPSSHMSSVCVARRLPAALGITDVGFTC